MSCKVAGAIMSVYNFALLVFFCPLSLHLTASSAFLQTPIAYSRQSARNRRSSVALSGQDVVSTGAAAPSVAGPSVDPFVSEAIASFDWKKNWYPVIWARDVPVGKPTKVTLFDTDFVLVRDKDRQVGAALDVCPHRLAALSEGRVTEQGWLQCAYHGWAFDSRDGNCRAIPQLTPSQRSKGAGESSSTFSFSSRTCLTVCACKVQQGVVWIHPFASPLEAETSNLFNEIPRVPELDDPLYGWCGEGEGGEPFAGVVRDLPIDYSLLVENILDPDHGLFAHCAKGFDLYTATAQQPQHVSFFPVPMQRLGTPESSYEPGGLFTIQSSVDAVPKLSESTAKEKKDSKPNEDKKPLRATSRFTPPCLIASGRRDPLTGVSPFIIAFWVCPVGVGRTRFMSASVARGKESAKGSGGKPKKNGKKRSRPGIPRWLQHLFINNFLDEDSHLLCTQQPRTLSAELRAHVKRKEEEKEESGSMTERGQTEKERGVSTDCCWDIGIQGRETVSERKRIFAYRSPTEKLLLTVGAYLDKTLPSMPNRYRDPSLFLRSCPSREETLDRWAQHTKICPDSMDVFERAKKIRNAAALSLAGVLFVLPQILKLISGSQAGGVAGWMGRYTRVLQSILSLWSLQVAFPCLLTVVASVSHLLMREFRFKMTDRLRDRKLQGINKTDIFPDSRLLGGAPIE
uniref:Rieske domain-containing protein n=1 Tax=Chromera velia CCMP2878 TaxID=1169474 RepID=A0A0G4GVX5_9ALVE|eukprot:Cvel_23616.t1-p1 / transcript=Cvel_23616.t1 / gene=Cvel_23616 / organism=Chromera_velia_CCMP2878 / gene_product=Protochlorophyllide-dependent translocon component, putative / transcript_product=Protochlorophyllide-dependent translocon component, putative / location=Cvel_scaffold2453:13324-16615(+) / protein_length=684 / sequence_SO=supercontig / SO=protein_coding / is_pseudo=false